MSEQAERHWEEERFSSFQEYVKKKQSKVRPKTKNHATYLDAIESKSAIVCTGPWGTGKTYMAAGKAVEMLRSERVKRIVLSRPLKECGEKMGFLPGDTYQKVEPMMIPLIESLEEFLEPGEFEKLRAEGTIVICPLEQMRGRTMKDAFVILDEAQNATATQLVMFLSRYGSGKMVLCGDFTQSDLPYEGVNSLREMVLRMQSDPDPDVAVVVFGEEDIVRSGLCRYFYRVMTKPFDPSWLEGPNQQKGRKGWNMVPCPECDKDVWYEEREDDSLMACPHCSSFIELYDAGGRLDPIIVDESEVGDDDLETSFTGHAALPAVG